MTPDTTLFEVHPTFFDWITIAAIIAGPVLALLVQRWLDWLREKGNRRRQLYFTLMSTRARGMFLSAEHVRALNTIDAVFDDKNIRDLWKKMLDHLNAGKGEEWESKLDDLRVDLYQAIGNKLGYRYTTDYIKRGIYFPQQHDDITRHQNLLLEGLAKAVENGKLKVELAAEPPLAAVPHGFATIKRQEE